ncbi:MAG: PAS domain S-box protein, partial [Gemmatimonadota bacterium]|nr:PAS domain S-box protein [Gemmatimonadota bacterium]
ALAARSAPPQEREVWARRVAATARDFQDAAARLRGARAGGPTFPAGTPAAISYAELTELQEAVVTSALKTASTASTAAEDSLVSRQWRFVAAMERVTADLEGESARRIDGLVQEEAACVILLLLALAFGIRLAALPTQARLQQTADALAESESRSRAVLDAMSEGMLLTDVDGRILVLNPSARHIIGVSQDEDNVTLEKVAPRLLDENGAPIAVDMLPTRITLRTGEPITNATIGVRGTDGSLRWLLVNTHPLFREAGDPPHAAVAIFRDVTFERRVAEERAAQAEALELQNRELLAQADALGRGEALFRSLVDTAGSAIVGLDREGKVFEWNREAEALFGVARVDAIGQPYAEAFVTPQHRSRMRGGIAAVLGGEPLRNLVGPVKSRRGEQRTVLWNITPLRAADGDAAHGLIAAGLDITEREASDERFRVLFERSSDAHLLYDEHGVIDCNDATLRMLRADGKEMVLGRSPIDLSPRRQSDGRLSVVVGDQMRQLARLRGYHRFEWMHQRMDGSEFPVEITLTPVRLNSREVILAVWHDIAERKAVEDALRSAKDAAESANRTKSEFMTRMNHELRTPLTAIIGFSRVLLQGKEGALGSGVHRYVERIRVNGMHLLSLINQILDVAKVEAGRMELDFETVAVDSLVRDTLAMLDSTAEAKGLVLRCELPPRMPPLVTDEGKLRQILINLVGNAIKFTNDGEVCVRVDVDPASGRATAIVVSDTGIGIPADRQLKVFDPFEQGDSSTRRQFGGTGLGLSIVKTFAALIGARITVESKVGEGTTFTVLLATPEVMAAMQEQRSA